MAKAENEQGSQDSDAASGKSGKLTVKLPKMNLPKLNLWVVSTIILLLVSTILFVKPELLGRASTTGAATAAGGGLVEGEVIAPDVAGQEAVDYINENLVTGGGVEFVEAEDIGSIYRVTTSYMGSNVTVYTTKDGEKLLVIGQGGGVFDTTKPLPTTTTQPTTTTTSPSTIKSDRPEAHAFVMSYCPYGLQFMKAYVPVIELLGDKADLQINFVDYVMHGEEEIWENLRMYCIEKEQTEKFTDYIRCFVKEGDYEECLDEVGIDEGALQTCMESADEEYGITETLDDPDSWGGSLPPFSVETDLNAQLGGAPRSLGSPAFFLNGQRINVARSPEAVKQAICSAFNTPPEECDTELSTTVESYGFGEMGSGSGASSSGEC